MNKEKIINEIMGSFKMTVDTKGLNKFEKYIDNLEQENKSLKSNWKALKEWANHILKQIHYIDKATIINKLNELESDKE